jgi:hypothetical protein
LPLDICAIGLGLPYRYLNLGGTNLTGEIPYLGTLSKLTALYLDDCQLQGTVPGWLGLLAELKYALLSVSSGVMMASSSLAWRPNHRPPCCSLACPNVACFGQAAGHQRQ